LASRREGFLLNHYDVQFGLGLTPEEKAELVQYLLSL
jgi:hypothetical protein